MNRIAFLKNSCSARFDEKTHSSCSHLFFWGSVEVGPPWGRNRSSLCCSGSQSRASRRKRTWAHPHLCMQTWPMYKLHTRTHGHFAWLLEMMDDVHEILLHFADFDLPTSPLSGTRWGSSNISAVSRDMGRKGPTCVPHTHGTRAYSCNTANETPNQTKVFNYYRLSKLHICFHVCLVFEDKIRSY